MDRNQPTTNEQLQDDAIARGVLIERHKNQQVRDFISLLNDGAFADVIDLLPRALIDLEGRSITSGVVRRVISRLADDLDATIAPDVGRAINRLRRDLVEIAQAEATWQVRAIRSAAPINLELKLPARPLLAELVERGPLAGKLLSEWSEDLGIRTRDRIITRLNQGLVRGESVDEMIRAIRGTRAAQYGNGILQTTRREAEALVRTAATDVTGAARMRTFRANKDVVKGWKWVATLDTRTCEVCGARDGKVYDIEVGFAAPHMNCRCTPVPVTKSWKELGIDLADAPAGTRASMDGQVAADQTWSRWIKRQSAARQDEALGPERARLLRAGKLDPGEFADKDRVIGLDELKRRHGIGDGR